MDTDGCLAAPVLVSLQASRSVAQQSYAVGDLNGDGVQDAVASGGTSNSIAVYLRSAGTLWPHRDEAVEVGADVAGNSPAQVTIADFNGDGRPDLLLSHDVAAPGSLQLYLNTGNDAQRFIPFIDSPNTVVESSSVAVADFTQDGNLDVLVSDGSTSAVFLLAGDGQGGLGAAVEVTTANPAEAWAVADLDGVQGPDLVIPTSSGLDILLNHGDGTFAAAVAVNDANALSTQLKPQVADFTGDGKLDVAVVLDSGAPGNVLIFPGVGDGSLGPSVAALAAPLAGNIYDVQTGDLDGDGHPDLVLLSPPNNPGPSIYPLRNDGHGAFVAGTPVGAMQQNGWAPVLAADLDNDGNLDVAYGTPVGDVLVYPGDGHGGFHAHQTYAPQNSPVPTTLYAGDLNGDGRQDLVTSSSNVVVTLNRGCLVAPREAVERNGCSAAPASLGAVIAVLLGLGLRRRTSRET